MVHTNSLRTLTECTQQRKIDHIFTRKLVFYSAKKEDFFEWIKRLEAACLQSGRDIHSEAPHKARGEGETCLTGLPMSLLWSSV